MRGYVTAYDVHDGEQKWRAYATGPDKDLLLAADFNIHNPQYGQKGLGLDTGGRRPEDRRRNELGMVRLRSQDQSDLLRHRKPVAVERDDAPRDNKWTMTIFGRDADTGWRNSAIKRPRMTNGTTPASTS